MIITNKIAKAVIKIARLFVKGVNGVAIWPFIFVYPSYAVRDMSFMKHERMHIKQWKRYWILGFPFIYLYYQIRYGYKNNPLEIEARKAEKL